MPETVGKKRKTEPKPTFSSGAKAMLVDWNIVDREFEHDQARGFFQNILNNMDNEFVVKFAQDFLTGISSQNFPLNKSLFLLKNLLSATPKYAFLSLTPPDEFHSWLHSIIVDVSNVTSSLRSVGLSVAALMTKNMRKDDLNLPKIGDAISCNILDSVANLMFPYDSDNFKFGRLLLHQIVDNVSSITDDSVSWIQPIGNCFFDVCFLLHTLSDSPPTFQGSGTFLVDISKLFNRIVSIWFTQCQSLTDEIFLLFHARYPNSQICDSMLFIRRVPESLFRLINSQRSLIHDVFQTAFYSALEITYRPSSVVSVSLANEFTGDIATLWVQRVISDVDKVLTTPPPSVEEFSSYCMDLGRLESLLLLVSSIFSLRRDLLNGVTQSIVQDALEYPWFGAAEQIFEVVMRTMKHLKLQGTSIPAAKQKMFRPLASNVRKASIALCETVLAACPLYLQYSQLNPNSSQQGLHGDVFVTSFCLKTLSTPSLFPQIYRSLNISSQITFEGPSTCVEVTTRDTLIRIIIKHLGTGLRQIAQYSMPAGIDLVATIEELAADNCLELISFDGIDIPLYTLRAYSQPPKVAASSSSDIPEWKTHCLSCLQALLDLYKLNTSLHCSAAFSEAFVEKIPSDIIILHKSLGNSPMISDEAPSARERSRKESLSAVASSFKTNNPEEFLPILHNLIELQNKYFEVMEGSRCEVPLSELYNLFTFLMDISLRPLLFEDDCSLLCSEIDLMSRFVSLYLRSWHLPGGCETNDLSTIPDVRSLFLSKLTDIERRVIECQHISDEAQVKMLRDSCQFHLQKFHEQGWK